MDILYKNPWTYNDEIITSAPENCVGFVYIITNMSNGMMYIGKKNFRKKIKARKKKGQKRRGKAKIKESDWKSYYGSSEYLKEDIEKFGKDKFKREIITYCFSASELTYRELEEQIKREALLRPEYYNRWIRCRVNAGNLKSISYE